jgi:hypothetical protein
VLTPLIWKKKHFESPCGKCPVAVFLSAQKLFDLPIRDKHKIVIHEVLFEFPPYSGFFCNLYGVFSIVSKIPSNEISVP